LLIAWSIDDHFSTGSLIIATCTRYFRFFSSLNYRGRLRYRRDILHLIFAVICDDVDGADYNNTKSSKLSILKWEEIAPRLSSSRVSDSKKAREIFALEDNPDSDRLSSTAISPNVIYSGYLSEKQFFRLMGVIAAKVLFRDDNASNTLQLTALVADTVKSNPSPPTAQSIEETLDESSEEDQQDASNHSETSTAAGAKESRLTEFYRASTSFIVTCAALVATAIRSLKKKQGVDETKESNSELWKSLIVTMAKINYTEISYRIHLPKILKLQDGFTISAKVFDIVSAIIHILLIIVMSYLTNDHPTYAA
jgi:hypothetical protein